MDGSIIGVRRGEEGFTVVELLVSVLVSMIVLAAISATFMVQNRSFTAQEQVIETQENVRAALQLMTKELLMAGYDPMGTADAGIEDADADTVQFTMDIDGDGDCDDSGERLLYALDTTDKQVTRNGQPIAENIEALSFSYFDSDGNELTSVPLSSSDKERVTRVSVEVTPKMTQSAYYNRKEGGAEETVIRLAYAGAAQVWGFVTEVLTPPYAFADATSTQDKKLKDSVAPPNLGKTRTGADTGGGSGSGTGGGTGFETTSDETWATESSSSS